MVTMLYLVHVYMCILCTYICMHKMYACVITQSILWLFVCMVTLLFLSWSSFLPALVCKVPHEFVEGTVWVPELAIFCTVGRCWTFLHCVQYACNCACLEVAQKTLKQQCVFLGAATGSPYIVIILRQSYGFMLCTYIYIYIYSDIYI